MRAGVLSVAILLGVLPVHSAQSDDLPWETWMDDPSGDTLLTVPAGLDLRRVDLALVGDVLHVRLVTDRDAGDADGTGAGQVASSLRFILEGDGHQVHVAVDGADGIVRVVAEQAADADAWEVVDGGRPWAYHVAFDLARFLPGGIGDALVVSDGSASTDFDSPALYVGGVDHAQGSNLAYVRQGSGWLRDVAPGIDWTFVEVDSFTGGPAIAAYRDGIVAAYYTRSAEGILQPPGVHVAYVQRDGTVWVERIDDFMAPEGSFDDLTRLDVAVDGDTVHVLYAPCPGQTCGATWRLASGPIPGPEGLLGEGWDIQDAAFNLDATARTFDKAALVAGDHVVYAAIPERGDRLVLRSFADRRDPSDLATFEPARLPQLAIDGNGHLHVAYFAVVDEGRYVERGNLVLASSKDRWQTHAVVPDLEDLSRHRDLSYDGGFAFAIDGVRPAVTWIREDHYDREPGLPDAGFATWDGTLHVDENRIPYAEAQRLAFDDQHRAHFLGQSSDIVYGQRGPDGTWWTTLVERGDMPDLVLDAEGRPVVAYTEPHGGTTLMLAFGSHSPMPINLGPPAAAGSQADSDLGAPGLGFLGVAVLLASAFLVRRK